MEEKRGTPKVSVCVLAYNHEKYIAECLQSLVDQQTDFDFEVLVGEDCSSDGTREIVQAFAKQYPHIVKPILQERNVGATRNYAVVHRAARGRYIAQMDGDDSALPGKLQAQADSLDRHPDVAFCAHAVQLLGAPRVMGDDPAYPDMASIEDLLMLGTYFANSSVMYRNQGPLTYPEDEGMVVDYYFHVDRASKGRILLDRRVLGSYRLHAQGMSKDARFRNAIEKAYERAFDHALELGVARDLVQSARLKRRMALSIARFLSGDVEGYRERIRIPQDEWQRASTKHRILHWTRFFPGLLGMYVRMKGMA